jgi:two-component system nitrate/nitrite response regulator NarL
MSDSPAVKTPVFVCDSQPIVAEGVRAVLNGQVDLEYCAGASSLEAALAFAQFRPEAVFLLDKSFGQTAIVSFLGALRGWDKPRRAVIWGVAISDAEALRFLQAGVRGILRKSSPASSLLECLRAVSAGQSWVADCGLRDHGSPFERFPRAELTPRERQVMDLVEQGFKNREIAAELGIRPGTVKIHLKHIFEKTGVRGRYGLALNGLKDRGALSAAS